MIDLQLVQSIRKSGGVIATAQCFKASDVDMENSTPVVKSWAYPKNILILGSEEDVVEFSNSAECFPNGFYQHI